MFSILFMLRPAAFLILLLFLFRYIYRKTKARNNPNQPAPKSTTLERILFYSSLVILILWTGLAILWNI